MQVLILWMVVVGNEVPIEASVGMNGSNLSADVKIIQGRLRELGFNWLQVDGECGPETIQAIRLFQAIKNGNQTVNRPKNDGLVEPKLDTHKWLQAKNAPRWQIMDADGPGFVNIEIADKDDDHDFGTNWLNQTIKEVAADYDRRHRKHHPAGLLTINDASQNRGLDTPDHMGHETGLSVDIRLPEKGNRGGSKGGLTFHSENYDAVAAFAILRAFRSHPRTRASTIYFNDPDLIQAGLCEYCQGHDDHLHVQIDVPPRNDR